MDPIVRFKEKAKENPMKIVYPEGEDERILSAASIVRREGIAKPILLGKKAEVEKIAAEKGVDIDDIPVIEPENSEKLESYIQGYCDMREDVSSAVSTRLIRKVLFFGAMMVSSGDADGMIGGISHSTASVLRACLLAIGCEDGISTASSFFIMVVPGKEGEKELMFADCAVNINPSAEQLAEIAITSGKNAGNLFEAEPRIAMLSFSTKGSASHEMVDKVVLATKIAREKAPELKIDGELQADAALVKRVAEKKAGESEVAGKANVFIFPDLNAGNICYKLVQYLAGAKAYGPILQGFKYPVNDLSRGATVEDVVGVTAITVVNAQLKAKPILKIDGGIS